MIEGEWENEPDSKDSWITLEGVLYAKMHRKKRIRKKWIKKYGVKRASVKLHGLVIRNQLGSLCGYVGVPYGHPYFRKNYYDYDYYIPVHGGITFSRFGWPPLFKNGLWYIGFDCAHFGDYVPGLETLKRKYKSENLLEFPSIFEHSSTYRNMAYVEGEVFTLAEYIANPPSH